MRSITELMAQPIFQAIGAALLHFVWQGVLVAALVASVSVLLQKRSARARYAAACLGMTVMLLLPVMTAAIVYSGLPANPLALQNSRSVTAAPTGNAQPASNQTGPGGALNRKLPLGGGLGWAAIMPWFVAIWLVGVLVFSLRAAGGWLLVNRLRRRSTTPAPETWQNSLAELAQRLRVSRPVRLCESAIAEVPAVIGWLRPVILVPVGTLTGLNAAQIEAVLAHELAHIRRHDYLVNLLQTAVETLLFYHPGVWWVSRRIRVEREHCCDDLAVVACGDVVLYARALTALEGLRSTAAPPLALAADGGSLLGRVRRLLGVTAGPSRATAFLAGIILLVSLGGVGIGAHHALLPVVTAKAEAIRSQVTSLLSNRTLAPTADPSPSASEANSRQIPHLVAEVNVPIPADPDLSVTPSASTDIEAADQGDNADGNAQEAQDSGSFIEDLAAAGYNKLTVDELIAFKRHGVTGAYVRELKAAGYDNLSVEDLLAFSIHGVTGDYARTMNAAGFGKLSVDYLLASRIHGVTPEYLSQMRSQVRDADFDQLLAFRIHGITQEYIKDFTSFGFGEPTADELLAARIHGITGDYVREMQGLGLGKLSFDRILAARIHGVTAAFVKKVIERGFKDVTFDQIIQLKIMGIIKDQDKSDD
jgi:beta-lactamase regulating signal transducer with metallopeptidase domain